MKHAPSDCSGLSGRTSLRQTKGLLAAQFVHHCSGLSGRTSLRQVVARLLPETDLNCSGLSGRTSLRRCGRRPGWGRSRPFFRSFGSVFMANVMASLGGCSSALVIVFADEGGRSGVGWFRHGLLVSLAGRLTRCFAGFVIGSGRSGRGKNAQPISHEDVSSEGNPARGIAFGGSCDLLCVQVFFVSCCDLFRFQL